MTMEQNEFTLANPSLENEVKLTCSLEEAPKGKRIRMELRNVVDGFKSYHLMDAHLNYTIDSADEATRLVVYLKKLIKQL